MACCLMAPNHYLNKVDLSSKMFCGIHLIAIPWGSAYDLNPQQFFEDLKKFLPHVLGTNDMWELSGLKSKKRHHPITFVNKCLCATTFYLLEAPCMLRHWKFMFVLWLCLAGNWIYCKTSNIRCTLGNKVVDHSDVLGLEHRLSALLQLHLHSQLNTRLQWIGQRQLQDQMTIILSFGIWDTLY